MKITSEYIEDNDYRRELERKQANELFVKSIVAGTIGAMVTAHLYDHWQHEVISKHFNNLSDHYISQIPKHIAMYINRETGEHTHRIHHVDEYVFTWDDDLNKWRMKSTTLR